MSTTKQTTATAAAPTVDDLRDAAARAAAIEAANETFLENVIFAVNKGTPLWMAINKSIHLLAVVGAGTKGPYDFPGTVVLGEKSLRGLSEADAWWKVFSTFLPQLLLDGYPTERALSLAEREAIRLTDPCEMRWGSLDDSL